MMDKKTARQIHAISRRVTGDMMTKGIIKTKPFAGTIDKLREERAQAKTLSAKRALDKMINDPRIQESEDRVSTEVNHEYSDEVSRRMDYEMRKAMREGKLKGPNRREYQRYMKKVHKHSKNKPV